MSRNNKLFFLVLLLLIGPSSAWAGGLSLENRLLSLVDFIGGLLDKNRTMVVKKVVLPYDDYVRRSARRYGLDPCLVHAIIHHESNYEYRAVSPVGAQGLMQLMPNTALAMKVRNSFSPQQNIDGGSKYYAQLLAEFNSHKKALTAYNYGPTRTRKGLTCKTTRIYVHDVLGTWRNLQKSYQYQ